MEQTRNTESKVQSELDRSWHGTALMIAPTLQRLCEERIEDFFITVDEIDAHRFSLSVLLLLRTSSTVKTPVVIIEPKTARERMIWTAVKAVAAGALRTTQLILSDADLAVPSGLRLYLNRGDRYSMGEVVYTDQKRLSAEQWMAAIAVE